LIARQEGIEGILVPALRCPDERASLAFGHEAIMAPEP
jgi:hypothetical protein